MPARSRFRALWWRNLGRVLFALTLLSLGGCFKVHVIIPNTAPADVHGRWVNGWLWGAVGGAVDASQFCGGRPVARITTKRSFGNLFISWLTFGIYTPSHVTVVCGQPAGYAPYPSPMPQPYMAPADPSSPYQPPPPPRY